MKIKVTARAFSNNPVLREALRHDFPEAIFNESGERYQGDALIQYLQDADGAIIGLEKMTYDIMEQLPRLQIIAKYGVGLDNIDQVAARTLGKAIGWTGGVNKRSVAEQTLGCMLGLFRNLFFTGFSLKQGHWNKNGGTQLSGKTVGLVGCGEIGTEVVQLIHPFGCNVLICDILDKSDVVNTHQVTQVEFSDLLTQSDCISLHVPLTDTTFRMINQETLRHMKPHAFLINTSRGEVIDQAALKEALQQGIIAGAAIDVYESEPPDDLELLSLPNLLPTPHIGGNAQEAVEAMGHSAIRHLREFFNI